MDSIDFAAIISVAFVGSFGHCIGMCGGFILAYSSAKIKPSKSKIVQFFPHIIYNFGRVTSYVILGMIFGLIGGSVTFSHIASGYVYFIIGLIMVLIGLSLMGKLKFLTSIELSMSMYPKLKNIFSLLMKSDSKLSFYLLGMLNGIIPCGLVYFFLISAVSSGSWYYGGLVMLIFGLSTIPALFLFGCIAGFLESTSFRELMVKIASIIIIIYGIYLSYNGFIATQQ